MAASASASAFSSAMADAICMPPIPVAPIPVAPNSLLAVDCSLAFIASALSRNSSIFANESASDNSPATHLVPSLFGLKPRAQSVMTHTILPSTFLVVPAVAFLSTAVASQSSPRVLGHDFLSSLTLYPSLQSLISQYARSPSHFIMADFALPGRAGFVSVVHCSFSAH